MSDLINTIKGLFNDIIDIPQIAGILSAFIIDQPGFMILGFGLCVVAFWIGLIRKYIMGD